MADSRNYFPNGFRYDLIRLRDHSGKCASIISEKDDKLEWKDCLNDIIDPHHIFIGVTSTKNGKHLLFSSWSAKCIGVGPDGHLIFNIGCDASVSEIMMQEGMIANIKKQCATKTDPTKCEKFVFEQLPSNIRIYWNVNHIKALKNDPQTHKAISEILSPDVNIANLTVDPTNNKWVFNYNQEMIDQYATQLFYTHSIPGKENEVVAWSGYRSTPKRVIIIFGSAGAGKSTSIRQLATQLNNPVHISYDIPIENLRQYTMLSQLETLGLKFPKSADPSAYRTFYKFGGAVSKAINAKVIENNIDCIIEKANIPSMNQITRLLNHGYMISFIL